MKQIVSDIEALKSEKKEAFGGGSGRIVWKIIDRDGAVTEIYPYG